MPSTVRSTPAASTNDVKKHTSAVGADNSLHLLHQKDAGKWVLFFLSVASAYGVEWTHRKAISSGFMNLASLEPNC
jgi:hypothetical protein